jgi:hypothetical protein
MKTLRLRPATDRENGAVAVFVAILCVVLFVAAALAVDIGNLTVKKQSLQNKLDAASSSGATKLPDANAAYTTAQAYLTLNGIDLAKETNLVITTWCIVPSTGGATPAVDTTQIPSASVCAIGSSPWTGVRCNDTICSIPCATASTPPAAGSACNAIKVSDRQTAPFVFGPVIGDGSGDTGVVSSGACRGGSCGGISTAPLNVAVLVDRTGSTASAGVVDDQVVALKTMMQQMKTATQFLAVGTMGKSLAPTNLSSPIDWCSTVDPASSMTTSSSAYFPGATRSTQPRFWNDFLRSDGSIDTTKAIPQQLACLTNANSSGSGTQLAAPLKEAARTVLGLDNSIGRNTTAGTTNVVFILTDGQPNERNNISGSNLTNVTVPGDLASTTTSTACTNFSAVANSAKANGVTIVAIGYGDATRLDCNGNTGPASVLAGVASPPQGAPASQKGSVDNGCGTTNGRTAENSDGDYYFCATTGAELAPIFTTALAQAAGQSKLIQFP